MANIDTRQLRNSLGIVTMEAGESPVSSTPPLDREVVRMAEIFFLLRFMETDNPEENEFVKEARELQRVIGTILAVGYREGDSALGIARDPWKARKYAGESNPEQAGKQTEHVYNGFRWFNVCRLFVVRLLRVLRFAGVSFIGAFLSNLSMLATIGGLSYGLEVIVDMSIVLKETFAERDNRWQRFLAVLMKDNRPHRLVNALVWFGVNFTCFFLTGGAAAILNVSLFVFDVLNDAWKGFRELKGYWQLAKTFEKKIEILKTDPVGNHKEITRYQFYLKQTKEKMRGVAKINLYQVAITLTILTGMILIFFPPAGGALLLSVFAIKMLGASLAMAGSLFGGLGRKLYTTLTTPREMPDAPPPSVPFGPPVSPVTSPPRVSPLRQPETPVNDDALTSAPVRRSPDEEKMKIPSFIPRRDSFSHPESPPGSPLESPRVNEPISAFPRRSRPSRCDLAMLAEERRSNLVPPALAQRSHSANSSTLFSRRSSANRENGQSVPPVARGRECRYAQDDMSQVVSSTVISPLRNA